jgi:ABC-type protease/lipase transport system fused ATPase/permease subunit
LACRVKLVSYLLSASLLGAVTYLCMIALWILVGTILNPNKNLVSGAALIVVVLVIYHTVVSLVAFRRIITAKIGAKLDEKLAQRIARRFKELHDQQEDKLSRNALEAYAPEKVKITIGDLFNLLDVCCCNVYLHVFGRGIALTRFSLYPRKLARIARRSTVPITGKTERLTSVVCNGPPKHLKSS